jgi:hypothetical protein
MRLRRIAIVTAAAWISAFAASSRADDWQAHESVHHTLFTRDGSEADLAFATQWLDAAEQLMTSKNR